MSAKFVFNKGAIARIAKSPEVAGKMLEIAQGIASDAAALDPSEGAVYGADVRITSGGAKTSGRAHARATVDLPEDFGERMKWRSAMPLFRVKPKA